MKQALIIIVVISALTLVLFYFTINPGPQSGGPREVSVPWQVRVIDAEHSEIFGLVLNQTTLRQARERFNQLDGIALFLNPQGGYSLEAYFGKVQIGPFSARLIANLAVSQVEMEALTGQSIQRTTTENGSQRWTLNQQAQESLGERPIRALTYIPSYGGMDREYLEQRFGPAASAQPVDETTQLLLYPQKGVRIMLDSEGKEMFEYLPVGEFNRVAGPST